jgi:hypothetical protein
MFGYSLFIVWCLLVLLLFVVVFEVRFVMRPIRKLLFPLVDRYAEDNDYAFTYCGECGSRLMVQYVVKSQKFDLITGKRKEQEIMYRLYCHNCEEFPEQFEVYPRKAKE